MTVSTDAEEAARLLEHPLIVAAFAAVEADFLRDSIGGETLTEREEARMGYRAVGAARGKLQKHLSAVAIEARRRRLLG